LFHCAGLCQVAGIGNNLCPMFAKYFYGSRAHVIVCLGQQYAFAFKSVVAHVLSLLFIAVVA
jgi:hypothetical protein